MAFATDDRARAINEVAHQWKIQNILKLAELEPDQLKRKELLAAVALMLSAK